METISQYLCQDHGTCDELYVALESAISKGDIERAQKKADEFFCAMEQHLSLEEKILFPMLDEYTGMSMGPTSVMRLEHQQMRGLMDQMRQALQEKKSRDVLGVGETLLILIQQHNMKEENILYPMADQALCEEGSDIVHQMEEMRHTMNEQA